MVAIIWAQEPYGAPSFDHAMESRRLVVLISTAILGFQGVTLAFDLLSCTALSWLYVRLNGFGPAPPQVVQQPAVSRFNRVDGRFALSSCGDFQERCRRSAPIQAACRKSNSSLAVVSSGGSLIQTTVG